MDSTILLFSALFLLLSACGSDTSSLESPSTPEAAPTEPELKPLSFVSHRVVEDAEWWWAFTISDVTNDGLQDIIYLNNNAHGGHLAFRAGNNEGGLWKPTIVAEAPPAGGTFAAGDLETGDMDGDGDQDIIAVKHTGEWDDAGESAELFYYENPSWTPHAIGKAKDAVKDLSVGDFDGDGRNDLAVLTFEESNLRVHHQQPDGTFKMVQDITQKGLHEGMDLGDIDRDGDLDIAANGFVFLNPGENLASEWKIETVNEKWNTQTGDWSANGTKTFIAEFTPGNPVIVMTHSERAGFPLAFYQRRDDGYGYTETVILSELPAAHTLQVFDMDLDGDLDIVTGINPARAVNLEPRIDQAEVMVLVNNGIEKWGQKIIEIDGIYNGRVADFEGDGDYDVFRYPNHEATEFYLIENQVK